MASQGMFEPNSLFHYKHPITYFPVSILLVVLFGILIVPLGSFTNSIHPRFTQRYTEHLDIPSALAVCLTVSNSNCVLVTTVYLQ